MGPQSSVTGALVRRDTETHTLKGRRSHSDGGRGWSVYQPRSAGTAGNAGTREKGLEQMVSWSLRRGDGPVDTLVSDLKPQGCDRTNFCFFGSLSLW